MIRIKQLFIAFIAFGSPAVALACGNEYHHHQSLPVDKAGKLNLDAILKNTDYSKGRYYPYWQNSRYGMEDIRKRLNWLSQQIDARAALLTVGPGLRWADLERALQRNVSYELLSDYAWNELRVGNKTNAVKLLEKLYAKYPNEYNIVANLGTAYEVTGKDAKALELLKKAVAINAASHYNSEWIHIKILEQKLGAKPDYKAIIGLKAGEDYAGWLATKTNGTTIPSDSLLHQVAYQLHERIFFIPPVNAVVGQLVLDFADLVCITYGRKQGEAFYKYALMYDPALKKEVDARLKTALPVDAPVSREPQ